MAFSFWSDEDHLFVARRIGFGWSINFNYIARKLGLIKGASHSIDKEAPKSEPSAESQQNRLRRQIETSKYEEKRR